LPNPPFSNSRWDGFAVRAADVERATVDHPVELRIKKEHVITAGRTDRLIVEPGWCCPIMSGAPLPEGTDAVVKLEDVELKGDTIRVKTPVSSGDGLWKSGSFWKAGEVLVDKGTRIRPYNVFKLAEAGFRSVEVFRKPKIAIFAVGDELTPPGIPLKEASRYGGVQYFIRALAVTFGMFVGWEGILPDSVETIKKALCEAREGGADLVITTGGTGKGVKDLIVKTWIECGGEVLFQNISLVPGKSTAGGVTGDTPWIALPGGVMGAVVSFVEACKIIALEWYGSGDAIIPSCKTVLGEEVDRIEGMYRATWGCVENRNGTLIFLPNSTNDANLRKINGYILIEPGSGSVPKGTTCETVVF
jgi:molybdenum cofactor synthesis domain-containing protein